MEEKAAKGTKRKTPVQSDSMKEKLINEKELQSQVQAAQCMLSLAEKHIDDGLKSKDLNLIEGGQVLKEAKEKIPSLTKKLKENKEEQLRLSRKK